MEAEIQGKKCQGQNYHALHQKLHTMGVPNSVSNRGCHKIANAVDSVYNKTEYNKLRIVCTKILAVPSIRLSPQCINLQM